MILLITIVVDARPYKGLSGIVKKEDSMIYSHNKNKILNKYYKIPETQNKKFLTGIQTLKQKTRQTMKKISYKFNNKEQMQRMATLGKDFTKGHKKK